MKIHFVRTTALLSTLSFVLGASAVAQKQTLSGELSVYLQAYYDPANEPETSEVARQIVAEYEKLHPDVTIKLVDNLPSTQDSETFLAARMAADQSPDVMWQQFGTRNLRGSSWWVPLNPYFDKPNPYIAEGTPGHEQWSDSFPGFVLAQTRAPDGNWYQASLDWVETGLYYNKTMFDDADIDPKNWKNWSDFTSDMRSLRDATGVDPLGMFMKQQGWSNWWWADDIFLTASWADQADSFYMEKYNDAERPWRQLAAEEIAKAIIDGKLDATDARMDDYLRMSKEFVELFPIDYAGIPSADDLDPLFFGEQIATVWTGSWKSKLYANSTPFEYGITYLPPITTADTPHAQNTSYRVGGPSSAGQYGIAQSAAKNGKLDLAVDFLMFVSAPQNFGQLATSYAGFIPMVAGAATGEVMSGFQSIAELPERMFTDPDGRLTIESGDAWSQAMQAYFLGAADEEATKTQLQKIWVSGANDLCTQQSFEWCPN